MRNGTRIGIPAVLLVSLLLAGCVPFGDAWFRFGGTVRDTSGNVIPSASVAVLRDGKPVGDGVVVTTDDHGAYEIFASAPPGEVAFDLAVTKAGYLASTRRFSRRQANAARRIDVVLEPVH